MLVVTVCLRFGFTFSYPISLGWHLATLVVSLRGMMHRFKYNKIQHIEFSVCLVGNDFFCRM